MSLKIFSRLWHREIEIKQKVTVLLHGINKNWIWVCKTTGIWGQSNGDKEAKEKGL